MNTDIKAAERNVLQFCIFCFSQVTNFYLKNWLKLYVSCIHITFAHSPDRRPSVLKDNLIHFAW